MNIETVPIDSIVPYWRNPRTISDEHITQVAESIERFGYQSPIIVDKDMTVIVGHTRLQALRLLNYETVQVVITDLDPKKAKEYRLIDNRTSELGNWDNDKLFLELREFTDEALAGRYFPEINFDTTALNIDMEIDMADLEKAADNLATSVAPQEERKRTVLCPHCYEEFSIAI